jgi:hypothetical protein
MWTYNGTTYVTYTPPAATAWYTSGTTNDAGSSKTSAIYRNGSVGINISPLTTLHAQNTLTATASVNANAQVLRMSRPSQGGIKWDNIAQFNLGSYSNAINANTRLDLVLNNTDNVTFVNPMTWLANGNIGINNNAPTQMLHLLTASSGVMLFESSNGSAGQASIDLKVGSTQYWRIIGQGSANGSRLDFHNQTTNSPAMSIMPTTSYLGVGTTNAYSTIDSGGSLGASIISSAVNITTTATNYTVVMTATGTVVTLQTPSLTTTLRKIINVKNASTGNITVTGNIDGTTQTLTLTQKESRTFHSNGVTWWII